MLHPQSFQRSFLETKMSCELSPRFVTHHRRVISKEDFHDEFQIVEFMKLVFLLLLLQNVRSDMYYEWENCCFSSHGNVTVFFQFSPSPVPCATQHLLLKTLAYLNLHFRTLPFCGFKALLVDQAADRIIISHSHIALYQLQSALPL